MEPLSLPIKRKALHPPENDLEVDSFKSHSSSLLQSPAIMFQELTLACHVARTLQIESEPRKYTERLADSLLKYFSFLYFSQHAARLSMGQTTPHIIQAHLQSVVQNLDLQMESKRLSMGPSDRHYTRFQYSIPANQSIHIGWNEYTLSVRMVSTVGKAGGSNGGGPAMAGVEGTGDLAGGLGVSPILASLDSSIEKVSDGDSMQSSMLRELVGKPASSLVIRFDTPVPSFEFEKLCHDATEYACTLTAANAFATNVYTNSDEYGQWELLTSHKKRPWDSVALPSSLKEELLRDVTAFLKNEAFYCRIGLRFKRVYLLLGPPASGKSSLIEALAGILNMDLCYLNFGPQLDDAHLCRLIAETKKSSILVIEDVDSLGIGREQREADSLSRVSTSCILNIMDGAFRQDGLITILTANSLNGFGDAFKRFGRIDKIFQFEYIQEPEMRLLFHRILPENVHDQWAAFYKRIETKPKLTAGLLQEFFASLALEHPDGDFNIIKKLPQLNQIIKSIEKSRSDEEKMVFGEI